MGIKLDREPLGAGVSKVEDYVTPQFLVAAIGASAGGLVALRSLLSTIPSSTWLSLILVQHLNRDSESELADILSRHTDLRVVSATENLLVEVGCVYVIAPDTQMTVIDGHLRIHARPPGNSNLCVDALFSSLAEYYRSKAVGVVLSGCLADGTRGMREIHAGGGTTICQDPDEAQFEGMPRSAIASGSVGAVLSAEDIGTELVRLSLLPAFDYAVG